MIYFSVMDSGSQDIATEPSTDCINTYIHMCISTYTSMHTNIHYEVGDVQQEDTVCF